MCDGTMCPCNLVEPYTGVDGVPWAATLAPWTWCPARLPASVLRYGSCELARHSPQVPHAVRWAGQVLRFATWVDRYTDSSELRDPAVWARGWSRCRGRLEPGQSQRWGRCDRRPHGADEPCALEFGFELVLFRAEVAACDSR